MDRGPEAWRADYERDGYLVVRDVLSPELVAKLQGGVEKITSTDPELFPPKQKLHLHLEKEYLDARPGQNELSRDLIGNAVRNIMEIPIFDPMFAELICHEPVLDVLGVLFGTPEFRFHNYKCIVKSPKVSSKFHWHRDLPYLEHTGPNLITAMLCIDGMTEENGATVVMPGTHRNVDKTVQSDRDIPEDQLPDSPRVTVICPAGSMVLFHVNIIHGGGANRSERPRRNIIGIWAGPDTHPIGPARGVYFGLMPRSRDSYRQKQVRMAFPQLFPA